MTTDQPRPCPIRLYKGYRLPNRRQTCLFFPRSVSTRTALTSGVRITRKGRRLHAPIASLSIFNLAPDVSPDCLRSWYTQKSWLFCSTELILISKRIFASISLDSSLTKIYCQEYEYGLFQIPGNVSVCGKDNHARQKSYSIKHFNWLKFSYGHDDIHQEPETRI